MPKPAPRRPRRTEPDHPVPGTTIGSTQILPPLDVERGLVRGTSNDPNEKSFPPYDDLGEVAKVDRPPRHPHGPPFTLGK
jgi:hypothetical protein